MNLNYHPYKKGHTSSTPLRQISMEDAQYDGSGGVDMTRHYILLEVVGEVVVRSSLICVVCTGFT